MMPMPWLKQKDLKLSRMESFRVERALIREARNLLKTEPSESKVFEALADKVRDARQEDQP